MLTQTIIDRVNKIDSCYIPHSAIDRAISSIERSILISTGAVEPHNVLLFGDAGTGKTTACNAVLSSRKRKFVKRKGKEVTLVPAFYSLIPNPVTIKGVASAMLEALGDPSPTRGSALDQTYRLGKLLTECETKVILLDELQHLLKRDNFNKSNNVKDWLKSIINEYRVPVIVVGTVDCAKVINTDSQLARRFTSQIMLSNLSFGVDKKGQFRKFLVGLSNSFAQVANFQGVPDFRSRNKALAVYMATGGNPADTTKLFKMAAVNALEADREEIYLEDFRVAFESLVLPNKIKKAKGNPFDRSEKELNNFHDQFEIVRAI